MSINLATCHSYKRGFTILIAIFSMASCHLAKKVSFEEPVDTTPKVITIQEKKTYDLKAVGVHAGNNFDGAHLNGFEQLNDSTAKVIVSPENTPINNSAYYAFETWADTPRTFYFTFEYPKGYSHRYTPKLKMDGNWSILDSTDIFTNDSIVTIKLNLRADPITVAAQQVQSSSDVKGWYLDLAKGKENLVHIASSGKSNLGRDVPVLDIYSGSAKKKDVVVLLTRQHPPEVTGYFAYQSFLETILDGSELSLQFLEKYRVLAFPIMNPDGVDLGNWRHNANGVDLNRDWSEYNQPEVLQVVEYINGALKKERSKLALMLDFHSTWYDIFYTNRTRDKTALPHFIDDWFLGLEQRISGYEVNEAAGDSKRPTSKGWALGAHKAVGITYEIGDETAESDIAIMGKESAQQMMLLLLKKGG